MRANNGIDVDALAETIYAIIGDCTDLSLEHWDTVDDSAREIPRSFAITAIRIVDPAILSQNEVSRMGLAESMWRTANPDIAFANLSRERRILVEGLAGHAINVLDSDGTVDLGDLARQAVRWIKRKQSIPEPQPT